MYDYQDYTVLAHTYNFSHTTLTEVFLTRGFKLVKGTEYVRAIFRKSVVNPQPVSSDPYCEIINELQKARIKHLQLMKKIINPLYKYDKGVVKVVLGRV